MNTENENEIYINSARLIDEKMRPYMTRIFAAAAAFAVVALYGCEPAKPEPQAESDGVSTPEMTAL